MRLQLGLPCPVLPSTNNSFCPAVVAMALYQKVVIGSLVETLSWSCMCS